MGPKANDFRSLAQALMPMITVRTGEHEAPPPSSAPGVQTSVEEIGKMLQIGSVVSGDDTSEAHTRHAGSHPEERVLSEIERFRVHALEVLEQSIDTLLGDVAHEVLGRELELSPSVIADITRRALRRFEREGPVRLRVASADVRHVESDLPIIADSSLTPGDLVIEVRDGEIDERLPVRLSCVVRDTRRRAARRLEG